MNENDGTFMFLPDISGFTAFVNQTEINHSHHILQELMEILLESNTLSLEVSEIEGDAVFFFKKGKLPGFNEIYNQAETMFLAFHNHLKAYEAKRVCKCGACSTASNLTIKFVAHAGQAQPIQIKSHNKLHGHDVILSHRLLKNNIPASEYLLLTDALLKKSASEDSLHNAHKGKASSEQYDYFDEVGFRFYDLHYLHQKIQDYPPVTFDEEHFHGIKSTAAVNIEPITLYDVVSNLHYRKRWNKRVKRLHFNERDLNYAGNYHTCVINNMNLNIQTLPVDTSGEDIIYAERIPEMGMMKEVRMIFTIAKDTNKASSQVTLEMNFQFSKKWLGLLRPVFNFYVKRIVASMLGDLKNYAEQQHKTEPVQLKYGNPIQQKQNNEEVL